MRLMPTIHLKGQCREAMALYQKAFGIEVKYMMTYGDAVANGWETDIPTEQLNWVYHSDVMFKEYLFHMADEDETGNGNGSSVFVAFSFDEVEDVKQAFEVLQEECKAVIHPLHSTEYSRITGSLVDKFGVRWGLMTEG